MEIRISWQSATIILLTVLVLMMGAYFYRGYRIQVMSTTINQTQQVLSQLTLTPQIAQVFKNIGWDIREVQPLPPVLPQRETPPEPEQGKEDE